MDIREKMLPVLQPKGGKEEVDALREVIESGWWGSSMKKAVPHGKCLLECCVGTKNRFCSLFLLADAEQQPIRTRFCVD